MFVPTLPYEVTVMTQAMYCFCSVNWSTTIFFPSSFSISQEP